jgi:cytochrome c biogenesis protein CcmG/thiol:disulfide interchange protein DsbE
MKAKFFVPLVAFVLLAVLLGVGLKLKPREVPSPFIGKPAPAFSTVQLHAPQQQFKPSDMQGQVWLFNVFASWCAPCREEHPLWVQLAREKIVPIVGLSYKDAPQASQEWLRKLGDPYTHIAVDRDGKIGIDYGVYGVPETFVVDKGGIIRYKHIGPMSEEAWTKDLLPLIRKLQS